MKYLPNQRCGVCEAPATFRFAFVRPIESPALALRERPDFRCTSHFDTSLVTWHPDLKPGHLLVLDPEFTHEAFGESCACGLPVDHASPASGVGRPCLIPDATIRMARVPAIAPASVTRDGFRS